MVRSLYSFLVISVLLFSCSGKDDAPDVSGIGVKLAVERFEQDFFAVDTNNLAASLKEVYQKYPGFFPNFNTEILGLPPLNDTSFAAYNAIKQFLRDYRPIKDSVDKQFKNIGSIEEDVRKGLQYVKYYFPQYKAPQKLITYIGPMDAIFTSRTGGIQSDVISPDALTTGLQLHLGSGFSVYHSAMGQQLYPTYLSRRFTPEYIAVNCMKNIIDDIYVEDISSKPLVEQMIEKGKRIYVLDKLMPHTPDTLKIGYTKRQLDGCYESEGKIWNFFLTNGFLLTKDPGLQQGYLSDAPSTPEFGEGSPGYIGLFVGWQIVKKFMEKNEQLSVQDLLLTDSKKIFEESKYKPK